MAGDLSQGSRRKNWLKVAPQGSFRNVHRTPHWTRTHAHFSRARVTFHSCALCMAQGEKSPRHFQCFTTISSFDVVVECPSSSLLSVQSPDFQRPRRPWKGVAGENPSAPARWSEPDRMADPAPNTGYEPNLSNVSYMDPEYTSINLPDSHHNLPCHHDATVISITEDPEGLPHSGASSSSKQTVAAGAP